MKWCIVSASFSVLAACSVLWPARVSYCRSVSLRVAGSAVSLRVCVGRPVVVCSFCRVRSFSCVSWDRFLEKIFWIVSEIHRKSKLWIVFFWQKKSVFFFNSFFFFLFLQQHFPNSKKKMRIHLHICFRPSMHCARVLFRWHVTDFLNWTVNLQFRRLAHSLDDVCVADGRIGFCAGRHLPE